MSTVIPIRRHQPTPTTGAEPTAEVVPLRPTRTQRPSRWPARRGSGGHHPDCPYGTPDRPVDHCGPCQGLRKAIADDRRPAPAPTLTACTAPGCYRPTDHHSGHCDRCQTRKDPT